jgi:iron complex outermembrane receptor protein
VKVFRHQQSRRPSALARALPFATAFVLLSSSVGLAAQPATLADLSLEELGQIRVTTVSRTPERVADAPASVFVITSEDIRRSGATSLPEALRLAPNLEVARTDSVQYAISARGFNNAVGNKLLVMIDGRTVYTPLFSGVFWDQQDVLLADVDRIEVISGPGATLWGANAVNGVINVITKAAGDTQGALVSARAGDVERQAAFRYGGRLGTTGAFRAYVETTALDRTHLAGGAGALDEWQRAQAGFRADWQRDNDRLTLQADAYSGRSQDRGTVVNIPLGRIEVSGANVLARWTRELDDGRELQVQSYLDRASRDDFLFFRPTADIVDIEVQHTIPLGRHDLIWGGDYRRSSDDIRTGFATTFIPQSRELDWESLFLQDRLQITKRLEATLGLKLESNDYTGTESLPSFRIAWKPSSEQLVWAALSRAVRAPSRYDRDVFFPGQPPFLVVGGPNFKSEVAEVLEAGYRAQPNDNVSFSVTVFHNDWDRLRSGTALPVQLENRIEGDTDGVEGWATWRIARAWQLAAGFSTLDKNLQLEPGSTDPVGVDNETLANDADYQWLLRASADLPHDLELDVRVRQVDALPNPAVPAYTAVDATLSWRPTPRLDLRLIGQNLFDAAHPEYGPARTRSEIERGVLLQATLRFGE